MKTVAVKFNFETTDNAELDDLYKWLEESVIPKFNEARLISVEWETL